jgi:ATP-binding cassette, subfamily C (CFTR/MRP), member 1
MRYRDGLEPVLRGVDLNIEPGERVGCVGRTGAGKSSMFLALLRLIEPYDGQILVDGVDLSELGLFDVRSRMSLIPQDPVLFNGTVRMNLDPFDNRTDEELWDALRHSYMDEHVRSLPDGLQHTVAEGGSNFSVGQRQLLCLARALLRKSKILLMDEATSSVSLRIGELIQSTIRDHFTSCTLLTIAHRLETVMEYDKVVVMEAGKVVETGNPRQLALQPNSLFASMVASSSSQVNSF